MAVGREGEGAAVIVVIVVYASTADIACGGEAGEGEGPDEKGGTHVEEGVEEGG